MTLDHNPFAAPTTDATAKEINETEGFLSAEELGKAATVAIGGVVLLRLLVLGLRWHVVAAAYHVASLETPRPSDLAAAVSTRHLLAGCASLVLAIVFVVSVIRVLRWLRRAHGNLPALGNDTLRFTPDRTVRCWFKPVCNLFEPYLAMLELVHGSDPTRYRKATKPSAHDPSERFLRIWWTSCLLAVFTFSMKIAALGSEVTPQAVLGAEIADTAVIAISGLLTVTIIQRVNRDQGTRYTLVGGAREESET